MFSSRVTLFLLLLGLPLVACPMTAAQAEDGISLADLEDADAGRKPAPPATPVTTPANRVVEEIPGVPGVPGLPGLPGVPGETGTVVPRSAPVRERVVAPMPIPAPSRPSRPVLTAPPAPITAPAAAPAPQPAAPLILPPEDTRPRTNLAGIPSFPKELLANQQYTIRDTVIIDGNNYLYHVTCPHGEFDVKGTSRLAKLCHEIKVIESFRGSSAGREVLVGMKQALLDIPRGATNLIVHPLRSAKAIGRQPARLVRGIGRVVRNPFRKKTEEEKQAKKEKTATGRNVADELFVSGASRKAAAELGVDAYSNNPHIQALLLTLGRRRTVGSIATAFMLPTSILITASNRSLTPGGLNVRIERMITDNGKAELKRLVARFYKERLGRKYKEHGPVTRLLDNPFFTPRQQAYLQYHLSAIGAVKHLNDVIEHLAACDSVEAAEKMASQMELTYLYHQRVRKAVDLFVHAGQIGLVDEGHKGVYLVPFDRVTGTPKTKTWVLGAQAVAAKEFKVDVVEVWITGDTTRSFALVCRKAGIVLRHRILEAEVFRE